MRFILTLSLALAILGCGPTSTTSGTPQGVSAAKPEGLAQLQAERTELKKQLAAKEAEIKDQELAVRRHHCQIVASVLGLLALVTGALAWGFKVPKLLWPALGLLALAAAVLFISSLAAWWETIGGIVLLLAVVAGAWLWYRDRKLAVEVVGAVEEAKVQGEQWWKQVAKPVFEKRLGNKLKPTWLTKAVDKLTVTA
jgi:hypothetical protein